jgi:hypothetical protein
VEEITVGVLSCCCCCCGSVSAGLGVTIESVGVGGATSAWLGAVMAPDAGRSAGPCVGVGVGSTKAMQQQQQ